MLHYHNSQYNNSKYRNSNQCTDWKKCDKSNVVIAVLFSFVYQYSLGLLVKEWRVKNMTNDFELNTFQQRQQQHQEKESVTMTVCAHTRTITWFIWHTQKNVLVWIYPFVKNAVVSHVFLFAHLLSLFVIDFIHFWS